MSYFLIKKIIFFIKIKLKYSFKFHLISISKYYNIIINFNFYLKVINSYKNKVKYDLFIKCYFFFIYYCKENLYNIIKYLLNVFILYLTIPILLIIFYFYYSYYQYQILFYLLFLKLTYATY